jgi:hypothetical protein
MSKLQSKTFPPYLRLSHVRLAELRSDTPRSKGSGRHYNHKFAESPDSFRLELEDEDEFEDERRAKSEERNDCSRGRDAREGSRRKLVLGYSTARFSFLAIVPQSPIVLVLGFLVVRSLSASKTALSTYDALLTAEIGETLY